MVVKSNMLDEIKKQVDSIGYYVFVFKGDGYKAYSLIFEKKNDEYIVVDHLSTESGYEEDIGDIFCKSKDYEEIKSYLLKNTDFFTKDQENDRL